MRIVVVGGSGLIGDKVMTALYEAGHKAVAASPAFGIDAFTGEGLDEAMAGADVVVDVSNAPAWEDEKVLKFFTTVTRNALKAGRRAGARHHVALSVLGCDRLPESGYMRAKVAQEAADPERAGAVHDRALDAVHGVPRTRRRRGNRGRRRSRPRHPGAADRGCRGGRIGRRGGDGAAGERRCRDRRSRGIRVRGRHRSRAGRDERSPSGRRRPGCAVLRDRGAGERLLPGPEARIATLRLADWLAGAATERRRPEARRSPGRPVRTCPRARREAPCGC